jgi:hypothetical protein
MIPGCEQRGGFPAAVAVARRLGFLAGIAVWDSQESQTAIPVGAADSAESQTPSGIS